MKLCHATIAVNPKKESATGLRREVANFLKESGVKIVSANTLRKKGQKKAHILITIGGDGTILYNKNRYLLPVFAIGTNSSYICQATVENWRELLGKVVKNGYYTQKRTMLASEVNGKALPDALNEVVIRNREHRILQFNLVVAGKSYEFMADGILFSTATGSPAYAYSCGGREMPWQSRKYQIVAIAPYRRKFKPLIVNPAARSKVIVNSTCLADAVVDGQFEFPVCKHTVMEVWVSRRKLEFVRPKR